MTFFALYVHTRDAESRAVRFTVQELGVDVVEINIIVKTSRPGLTKIGAGAIVRFANNDSIQHEVLFADMSIDDSGILEPGESFQVKFDSPVSYLFVCVPQHPGMCGTIGVIP